MAETYELLSTKLTPPRLRPALVPRERLLARLSEGLDRKLTLLSAPAGFGKTTLATEWLNQLTAKRDDLEMTLAPVPGDSADVNDESRSIHHASRSFITLRDHSNVAWLSLDAGDNDPVRFWRYNITACQTFHADLGRAALALLQTSQQLSFETLLTSLINELAGLSGKYILVLEDYHTITSPQIHETVAFLLDHLPAALHLVIITRNDPSLPLARLRARNELNELQADDLRFSPEEIRSFFRQAIQLPLSAEAIEHLEARTEGWVAGLRLAALALQGRQDIEQFLITLSGSHGHILEYLVEEVLNAQPAPRQEFLLQTTFLSRLTASLCDAVTGRNDSELMLEQLERANLFLNVLDGARQWYRYHALFAEAMQHYARHHLGEASLLALHKKASLWYEQHGFLAEAIETALTAQAFTHAAQLMERIIEAQTFYVELHTLRRWIERLPETLRELHPTLCFNHALAILFTADRRAPGTAALLERPLQIAEAAWQAENNQAKLGEVLAFRSMVAFWQGDFNRSYAAARQALELLPESQKAWRGISLLNVGLEEIFAGRLKLARQTLLEAQALCEASENINGALAATFLLASVHVGQRELHQGARIYHQVLAEARKQEVGEPHHDEGHALLGLASLAYEWNDLESAERDASQALDFGRELGAEDLIVPASLLLARLKQAAGETEQARQLLQALAAQIKQPHLLREVQASQAHLALASGDLATVQRWSAACAGSNDYIPLVLQEREALIVARLLLAQDEAEAVLRLLRSWQADAQAHGRMRSELEMLILIALAQFSQNHLSQAKQMLNQALTLAQPEGYYRLFLDEGEKMAALLQAVLPDLKEEPLINYANSLLQAFTNFASPELSGEFGIFSRSAFDSDFGSEDKIENRQSKIRAEDSQWENLVEPLSPQEERVLRLLAAGLSNPEIADELVVSINTIKTQVKSIYRKLNVHSREEAGEAARRLKFFLRK
jgi:LuxR family maltose regulon positive regulatory protein